MTKINKTLISILVFLIWAAGLPTPTYGEVYDTFSATLVEFEGEAFLQKPEEEIWLPLERDIPIEQGDRIKTGHDGYVEILVDDGSVIKLEEDSEMTLDELSADSETQKISSRVFLWVGRLLSNIARFAHSESSFEVHTHTVVAGVRGTEFVVEATDSEQTDVGVFDGEVAVGGVDQDGRLIKESEVLLSRWKQTTVQRNKRPLPPFALKERMLRHKKKIELLRKKAIERRRELKKIIKKRKKAREKILKKWKEIRDEKHRQKKSPEIQARKKNLKRIKGAERRLKQKGKRVIRRLKKSI